MRSFAPTGLICLSLIRSALGRNGPLGPSNNYLAPAGTQISTSSQTWGCTLSYNPGYPPGEFGGFQEFYGLVKATIQAAGPTRVGRHQEFNVTVRLKIEGSPSFIRNLSGSGITQLGNYQQVGESFGILGVDSNSWESGDNTGGLEDDDNHFSKNTTQTISIQHPMVFDIPFAYRPPMHPQNNQLNTLWPGIKANKSSQEVTIGMPELSQYLFFNLTRNGIEFESTLECNNNPVTEQEFVPFMTVAVGGQNDIPSGPNPDLQPITSLPPDSLLTSVGANFTCDVHGVDISIPLSLSLTTFLNATRVLNNTNFQLLNTHGTFSLSKVTSDAIEAHLQSKPSAYQFQIFNISTYGRRGLATKSVPILLHANILSSIASPSTKDGSYSIDFPAGNGVLPSVTYRARDQVTSTPNTIWPSVDGLVFIYLEKIQMNILALDNHHSTIATLYADCSGPKTPDAPLIPLVLGPNLSSGWDSALYGTW